MSQLRAVAVSTALLFTLLAPSLAAAQHPAAARSTKRLEIFGAVAFMASPAANGGALVLGTRYAVGEHVALDFDVGYGVMSAPQELQDRWWLIPSIAYVATAGDVRIDVGFGFGIGAASGLGDIDRFLRGPGLFAPQWAYQMIPTVRAHVAVSLPVGTDCDAFVRLDVASLILDTDVGMISGTHDSPTITDTTWATLSVGFAFRAL